MKTGTKVLVHGKTAGTVVSLHGGGKRIQVAYENGETRFVNAAAVKAVEPVLYAVSSAYDPMWPACFTSEDEAVAA